MKYKLNQKKRREFDDNSFENHIWSRFSSTEFGGKMKSKVLLLENIVRTHCILRWVSETFKFKKKNKTKHGITINKKYVLITKIIINESIRWVNQQI